MSKTLTGAGYLLHSIGFLIIMGILITLIAAPTALTDIFALISSILGAGVLILIGALLVNIGFILMGRKYDKTLWLATGIIGIIVFVIEMGMFAVMAGALYSPESMASVLGQATGALDLVVFLPAFIWVILEIVVLWSAGNYFGSGILKAAAILQIIALILVPIGFLGAIGMILDTLSNPQAGLLTVFGVVYMFVAIISIAALLIFVSLLLASIGFLKAKEPEETRSFTKAPIPPPPPI